MSQFKISCPHCMRPLNVSERAIGQTVACPGCNQPITVPQPAAMPASVSRSNTPGRAAVVPSPRLPPGMPPLPNGNPPAPPPSDFLRSERTVSPPPPPAGMPPLPGGMPPLPPTSDESGRPQSPVDLLAEYHRTSKPRGGGIKEAFTGAFGAAKKRGLALKVGHEVKNLQMAIDTQLETLGTLTLTHRPPVVCMGAEIAELSQIQDELSRRETTLESLRGTKGGGSAVKELNREASQLRDRQRTVMAAIGRATWVAKPEMPGAAGVYAALDRLQSSCGAKQAELKVLADTIGPLWNAEAARFGRMRKPAIIAGIVGGGLIVLYLLWSVLAATLFAAGLPSWARYYAPNDTLAIGYFNMDTFRKTQVFEKLDSKGCFLLALKSSGPMNHNYTPTTFETRSVSCKKRAPFWSFARMKTFRLPKLRPRGNTILGPRSIRVSSTSTVAASFAQDGPLHVLHCAIGGVNRGNLEAP